MKKVSRLGIAAGIVLILVGLIWSGFSWSHIRNDVQRISHKGYTNKQVSFDSSSIKNVSVNLGNINVILKTRADASQVKIAYFESQDYKFNVTSSDGTVSVSLAKNTNGKSGFCLFRCMGSPASITIYVPTTSDYSYDLTANNASVAFDNTAILRTQTIRVNSSNSNVKLQGLSANGTVSLNSSNGSIQVRDVTTGGKLSLESSNATNTLSDVQAPTISSRTDNGSATLDSVTAKSLTVNTSNATIALNRLMADHSTLTSDNGGIEGTLVGSKTNYATMINDTNGDVRVNGTKYSNGYSSAGSNLAKSLTVRASNASVKIEFVQ